MLLSRTPPLPDGTRVRLRLPHSSDRVGGTTVFADEPLAPGIGALLEAALHERAAGRRVA